MKILFCIFCILNTASVLSQEIGYKTDNYTTKFKRDYFLQHLTNCEDTYNYYLKIGTFKKDIKSHSLQKNLFKMKSHPTDALQVRGNALVEQDKNDDNIKVAYDDCVKAMYEEGKTNNVEIPTLQSLEKDYPKAALDSKSNWICWEDGKLFSNSKFTKPKLIGLEMPAGKIVDYYVLDWSNVRVEETTDAVIRVTVELDPGLVSFTCNKRVIAETTQDSTKNLNINEKPRGQIIEKNKLPKIDPKESLPTINNF
ncbi:MAG: hypothetical protein ACOYL6_14730 [Bacteriovoracaceae bacterium]